VNEEFVKCGILIMISYLLIMEYEREYVKNRSVSRNEEEERRYL
jgi:hypothetical protein